MSSHGYSKPCPVCGEDMICSSGNRPYDMVCGDCYTCGFSYYTKKERLTFEDVNYYRQEQIDDGDDDVKLMTQEEYDQKTKEVEEFIENN